MRELFSAGKGHGHGQTLEDVSKLIDKLKAGKSVDNNNKLGLHNFGYLFPDLAANPEARLPKGPNTIASLRKLGTAMADPQPQTGSDSDIPAGYTYLGQFVDHDITRDAKAGGLNDQITLTDFDPVLVDEAPSMMKNIRTATLELDSVYGAGPEDDSDLYENNRVHLKLGSNRNDGQGNPDHISSRTNNRDLLRDSTGKPIIGDDRNDENLLVAQTHHAFKVFHNKVADSLTGSHRSASALFAAARKKTIQHYQWLVLHDFLPRIVNRRAHQSALAKPEFYKDDLPTFMPFEFSVAAYRFGHSMIRQRYEHNNIFGPEITNFDLLFAFTHTGRETMPVPQSWIINWQNFYDTDTSKAVNVARPIDTRLSGELERLPNEQGLMAMLATRNLLRGYLMSLPSGQAVAQEMGLSVMSEAELQLNANPTEKEALSSTALRNRTPLWYYILKESSVRENGKRLGEVGSTIVAETLTALIRRSEHSILSDSRWQPDLGAVNGRFTMTDMLQFCGFEEMQTQLAGSSRRSTSQITETV